MIFKQLKTNCLLIVAKKCYIAPFAYSRLLFRRFRCKGGLGCGEAVVCWWQNACETSLICFINVKNDVVFLKKAHPDRQTVGVIGKILLTLQLV